MQTLEEITKAIMADPQNKSFTEQGIKPLFAAPKNARIHIVGQAPGLKTQQAGLYWQDKSSAYGLLFSGTWQVWGFTAS